VSSKLVLSASSLNTFLRCGQQWYFAYVAGIKRPPSLKAALGIALHEAVEVNYQQKKETRVDLPVGDVIDAFDTAFVKETSIVEEDPEESKAAAKDSGVKCIRKYQLEVAPSVQPIWVEEKIRFDINGIPWSGSVDLVDEMRRLRDLKSTARKPKPEGYKLNMVGYALGYRHQTGETESDVWFDYVVRTKDPYYLPVKSGGPVTDDAIASFADTVTTVDNAISAGSFVPNGLQSGACSWCGYRDMCPAFKAQK
jgi:CRISPR/Cas system-associated exonuclease Cas4 (RecB family)